jgi:hypothetical protein
MFSGVMQRRLGDVVENGGYALDPLAELDRCVCLMAGAQGTADVVTVVRDYLAAWPAERVASMQRVDAGWAPFDDRQKPTMVERPADVHRACQAVHVQCVALRGAGMVPTAELLELDLFLFLASVKLAEFEPEFPAAARIAQSPARAEHASRPIAARP